MASTYTPSLKIELMATGDQVNDWGTTTNSNLENGLEQAIVGRGVVEYTSDANKTITLTESNTSQDARNLFLYVDTDVSTTLTVTRDLIVPTIEKTYIVHNDTAGAQSIRVKTSGGTGITIPNGKKALLYVDGTNVIEQLNYLTSMEIGTPLPIASGGTNATSASAARTSLGLAIGTDVQAYNAGLQDISGLAKTNNNFIVGDGTNWVAESGATVRTSLGLGSMAVQDSNAVSISAGTATLTSMTTNSATITGGTITGITDLAVADGGTGSSSLTLNSVLIGNGTSPLLAIAPGTTGNLLTSNGTTWVSSAVASGVSSFSAGTTGFTPNTATTGAVTLAGTLAVANGGTGAATLTANSVLVGAGTSAVTGIAAGTSGNVLTSNGTTWASSAAAGGGFSSMVALITGTAWTSPPTTTGIKVTVVGGGGTGYSPGPADGSGGGGGGGGSTVRYFTVTAATPYSYAIGGAGGTSSFGPVGGTTISATGGGTGTIWDGASGGAGSGGTANINGGTGASGAPTTQAAGGGGSSIFGGGGSGATRGSPGSVANGSNGGAYGGGGGGGRNTAFPASSASGGTGSPGVVIIEY